MASYLKSQQKQNEVLKIVFDAERQEQAAALLSAALGAASGLSVLCVYVWLICVVVCSSTLELEFASDRDMHAYVPVGAYGLQL